MTVRRSIRRGYTLVELLITVALLGLAAAVIVPQFTGTENMRVQAAVRQIIADLTFAQSDALAFQEFRRVHFFEDGSGYCIVRVDETDFADEFDPDAADYIVDPLASSDEGNLYIVDFTRDARFSGVVISDVALDDGWRSVVYDPIGGTIMSGNLPGSGGSITVEGANVRFRITVAPFTGKLSVTEL